MRQDEEFSPLRVVRKNITDFDRSAYRVYKSETEFVTVEAATALEAFRESGIAKPLRIVREIRFMDRLVDQARFTDMEEIIETGMIMEKPPAAAAAQADPTRPAAPAQAAAPTASPPAEAVEELETVEEDAAPAPQEDSLDSGDDGLSEDDVAKLLEQGD